MSVLESIGNTPLVELKRLNPNPNVRLFAKLEGNNPGGSVKDRPAFHMIQRAEAMGVLTPDKIILEATSGNTGIAIAMIGAAKGYKVILTLPKCVSQERRSVLQAYGAEVVLTCACESTDGAIRKAHEMLDANPDTYFMPNQFANQDNVMAHYEGTGPEIFQQTHCEVTHFVAGMGTTGTLMGVSKYLKEQNPKVKIVGVEPVGGHKIQGLKNMTESMVPDIYDRSRLDDIVMMSDEPAFDTARRLAVEEGIFSGISSGAAVAGAIEVARQIDSGTIVTLIPDRGDRYLSTTLFRSVCAQCPP